MKLQAKRKLRLEKVVTSKQLRLAVERDEEDSSYHTNHVDTGDRGRKRAKKWRFDLDLTCIEIGVFKNKNSRNELARP